MPAVELEARLRELAGGTMTYNEIAEALGKSQSHIADTCRKLGLQVRPDVRIGKPQTPAEAAKTERVRLLANGIRSAREIAQILGMNRKAVEKQLAYHDLPRRARGSASQERNGQWRGGRVISLDGYAHRSIGGKCRKPEHRIVMEQKIGRPLLPGEVVDHIDSLHLNNDPSNLRLFASNADHIRATISGQVPQWSAEGLAVQSLSRQQRKDSQQVHTYRRAKASGDVRLLQILLAAYRLGTDSPYLSGTPRWLERAQISDLSRPSLERHIRAICERWEWHRIAL